MATKKAAKKAAKKPAKKAPAKKAPAKKAPAKKAAAPAKKAAKKAPAKKRKLNPALSKPLTPSPVLAAVVGDKPLARTEAVKRIWDHIKKNKLQDAVNRRMINGDEKLRALFGKAQVSMFDLAKAVSKNLK